MTRHSNHPARRGITLIEILFAIGIVVIGVFGIMAILLLAGARARQAIDASQVAASGRQAIGQIAVRGWQRADMVLLLTPSTGWQPLSAVVAWRQNPATVAQFRQVFLDGRISYCLDPLLVARSLASSQPMRVGSPESRFPYRSPPSRQAPYPPMMLTMPRATVTTTVGVVQPIPPAIAERTTTLLDDLKFDAPADRTLLPRQVFDRIIPGGPALRRANHGNFSWFATVTPGLDMTGISDDGEPTRLDYVLSVVVLKDRVPPYRTSTGAVVESERQVQVERLLGNGHGGGTVSLIGQSAAELAVRRGNWVMLSGICLVPYVPPPGSAPGAGGAPQRIGFHTWYRVIGRTDPVRDTTLSAPNQWRRQLTLEGPDWPLSRIVPGTMWLTIVDNAVSVSSKTFRFEPTSGSW